MISWTGVSGLSTAPAMAAARGGGWLSPLVDDTTLSYLFLRKSGSDWNELSMLGLFARVENVTASVSRFGSMGGRLTGVMLCCRGNGWDDEVMVE